MTTQSITPVRLLRDSLISVIPIYKSLLVFRIPESIFSLLQFVIPEILFTVLNGLYLFSINITLDGAAIFFTYKKLNQEEVTISQSLQKATEKFSENLILQIINFLLLLSWVKLPIILIFFPRLFCALYLIIIKNYLTPDAVKRSWVLTKGYGWRIFWNFIILNSIIGRILKLLPSLISASIFGVSFWEVNSDALSATHPAFVVNKLFWIAIDCFIYQPLSIVFVTLMFLRLLAKKN